MEPLAIVHLVNKKELFMKNFLIFLLLVFSFVACSDDSSESETILSYHYDTSISYNEKLLLLDSISNCLYDESIIESIYKYDTIFTKMKQGEKLLFFSQVHSFKDNIKSIGTRSYGDTLEIELIEKDKTPTASLYCPVWVYSIINGEINAKYIKTFTGVYPLGKK